MVVVFGFEWRFLLDELLTWWSGRYWALAAVAGGTRVCAHPMEGRSRRTRRKVQVAAETMTLWTVMSTLSCALTGQNRSFEANVSHECLFPLWDPSSVFFYTRSSPSI